MTMSKIRALSLSAFCGAAAVTLSMAPASAFTLYGRSLNPSTIGAPVAKAYYYRGRYYRHRGFYYRGGRRYYRYY